MALKTFNLDAKVYGEFSKHCKKHGISMSKKVENFIKTELQNINSLGKKVKKEDIDPFQFDIEKDVKTRRPSPSPSSDSQEVFDDHPMGKYC